MNKEMKEFHTNLHTLNQFAERMSEMSNADKMSDANADCNLGDIASNLKQFVANQEQA